MSSGFFIHDKVDSILPNDLEDKKILDVGFGYGYNGFNIRMKKRGKPKSLIGIDLFKPYCDRMRKLRIYDYVINDDIMNQDISYLLEKINITICTDVLEHQEREKALELLDKLISITDELLIISTPLNFIVTKEVDGNKKNEHLCKIGVDDFKVRGFKVEILPLIHGSSKERLLYRLYCKIRGKPIRDSIIAVKDMK